MANNNPRPWLATLNKALEDPFVQQSMATLGIALDPEGVGGHIGQAAKGMISSRQAAKANVKGLADTLTPPGVPGPTSVERNKDGSTTITGDYPNTPVTPTVPRAQQVPDREILGETRVPAMSPDVRRRVIARARQRGISPVTAMNLVTYDLANVNEPYLSRYDPESNVDLFAELVKIHGNERAALVAYRGPDDPDYLGNVTAYTPYSMRAIDATEGVVQPEVQTMIASREAPVQPSVQSDVVRTLQPYLPSRRADPTVSNDISPQDTRVRGLVAEDLYGLTPAEQNAIVGRALEARQLDVELTKELIALAKPPAAGVDRDAVSAELFGQRYYDLTSQDKERVNLELRNRQPESQEVVSNEQGIFVVDKRAGTARKVTLGKAVPVAPAPSRNAPTPAPLRTELDTTLGTSKPGTPVAAPPTTASTSEFVRSVTEQPILQPGEELPGKSPTEAQLRAFGYGSRALQAEAITESLEADPANKARIATLRSHLINKVQALGSDGTVGYAGGLGATAAATAKDIVNTIKSGGVITPRYAPRLTPLVPIIKVLPLTAAIGLVVNVLGSTFAEPIAQSLRTPEEQSYAQAKLDFISSVLRKESGAAILADEFAREDKRYYPQVNDKPLVIAQKQAARQQVIKLLREESGRGLLVPTPAAPTPAAPTPTPANKPATTLEQESALFRVFVPHTGPEIVAGAVDEVIRELMTLDDVQLNIFMGRGGIPRSKQSAIRLRIKQLKEQAK